MSRAKPSRPLFAAFGAVVLLFLGMGCATVVAPPSADGRLAEKEPTVSENIEVEVVEELNRARTNPSGYADLIALRVDSYDGKEGRRAIREAIRVLRRTEPVPPLIYSNEVSLAARDHVRDQGRTGRTGHEGSDGSGPFSRIRRYVDTSGAAENISYGLLSARDIVVELLIDDGVLSRGHRTNILNPNYSYVGVATGPHERYRFMCVMDFTYPIEALEAASE